MAHGLAGSFGFTHDDAPAAMPHAFGNYLPNSLEAKTQKVSGAHAPRLAPAGGGEPPPDREKFRIGKTAEKSGPPG